ncbi:MULTISPECIES: hypothetical protein [unclassified Archaeoglobus]|jgi:hypothetical protein|uniref:hypothetical protein n=1 Tax=unclassified Archaeoglobus TaxID=2643606 RepID=UPI0025C605AE|nr:MULTISPECIES: hypothetical protein [unclassified Archaeoglobus]
MVDADTLFREILEEKALLAEISQKLEGDEDLLLQYPDSTKDLYLKAGESYERELQINRRLRYLSLDVPDGVLLQIFRNNSLWLFAEGEIGAIQFKNGVHFEVFKVVVVNSSEIDQKWSLRVLFS